ncbi:Hypothetical predicted protein [Octopus vulgaris]|uniref:Uncharacterized protein n=1 Tax=Octopus vulgaris TaxID=6645 RepID=A0AA36F7B3_OCTVU|nr:Hypothetical predicted protein [Octopus vulgaris]
MHVACAVVLVGAVVIVVVAAGVVVVVVVVVDRVRAAGVVGVGVAGAGDSGGGAGGDGSAIAIASYAVVVDNVANMSGIVDVGVAIGKADDDYDDDDDDFNPKDSLIMTTNMFVCTRAYNDGIPSQICPPYSGPYRVLQRREKYFVINMNGKPNTISID